MNNSFPTIRKPAPEQMQVKPNLDYDRMRPSFQWEQMYAELDWLPGGALNKAHEAIDRHANGRRRDKIAMLWEGKNGEREDYTFGYLKTLTNRFANVLKSLGIEKGDRVFIFMDRIPALYIALFGILKTGAIAGPLFSAFGPDPVRDRLKDSSAKDGYEPTTQLRNEPLRFTRQKLSAAVAPREIEFVASLPKTRSGKIMRRLLKAREMGLPEGDTSTLED